MKFRITFKDPDGVGDCTDSVIKQMAKDSVVESLKSNKKVLEPLEEHFREVINEFMGKWIEYNEYATIEFDTDANTCTVVPV